jgi:hypothetical protein
MLAGFLNFESFFAVIETMPWRHVPWAGIQHYDIAILRAYFTLWPTASKNFNFALRGDFFFEMIIEGIFEWGFRLR